MTRALRLARWATFVYFGLDGFLIGLWVVHIPVIQQRVGVGNAVLGWLLLLLGAGAFVGMRLAGPVTDRLGPRVTVPTGAVLCSAALVLPGLATGPLALGAALLVFGFGNGCLDVSMNAHAIHVERAYRRPVMSAFHACWSVGGVLASLIGAQTLARDYPPAATLGVAAGLGLLVGLAALPMLMRVPPSAAAAEPGTRRRRAPGRIWALALLALLLMLSEGVANDWSAVDMRDVLRASASTAALAYGAFATAMTVGRLLTDRFAGRFGAVAVLRYGGGLAAIGLATAALSPWIGLALVGWTLFGAGLSGCVPQLFSAAGHTDPAASATNVSRVASFGYLGILAGPAIIGPLTRFAPLNLVFLLPVALCLASAAASRIVRPAVAVETAIPAAASAATKEQP